jgi:predicted nucleic acid-binding protein
MPSGRTSMTGSTANARALADTNVVVYAYDLQDPVKHQAARDLLRDLSDAGASLSSTPRISSTGARSKASVS